MLSLCYLPTAGRLTATIIKAKNLRAMDITGTSGNDVSPVVGLWVMAVHVVIVSCRNTGFPAMLIISQVYNQHKLILILSLCACTSTHTFVEKLLNLPCTWSCTMHVFSCSSLYNHLLELYSQCHFRPVRQSVADVSLQTPYVKVSLMCHFRSVRQSVADVSWSTRQEEEDVGEAEHAETCLQRGHRVRRAAREH